MDLRPLKVFVSVGVAFYNLHGLYMCGFCN